MLLLLALLAETVDQKPTVMIAEHAHPVVLLTKPGYPLTAYRNGWQGIATADLTISPEGKVTACQIVRSTGHDILDTQTCYALTKEAQFAPAHDEAGKPVEDHFRTPPITWRIPR